MSFRTARVVTEKPVSKTQKNTRERERERKRGIGEARLSSVITGHLPRYQNQEN